MKSADIVRLLAEIPDIQATASPGHITIGVPGFDDAARLSLFRVRSAERAELPGGETGVVLGIAAPGQAPAPLVVTAHALGYAPVALRDLLDGKNILRIANTPDLVTYAEMDRDARTLAGFTSEDLAGRDLMGIAATMLLVRCFIAGAIRVGLRPLSALSAWEQAMAQLGAYLPMPAFKADEAWDKLLAAAGGDESALVSPQLPRDPSLDTLTVEDFEALAPGLAISRLDEEFVGLWRQWMPVHPAKFAETLLQGLEGARAHLALYPDGGGFVDLTVEAGGRCLGLFQLGFSFWDGEFSLDEVSTADQGQGTGLFKTFMRNMDDLAALLHFEGIHAYFTGVGSYVGAKLGFLPQ